MGIQALIILVFVLVLLLSAFRFSLKSSSIVFLGALLGWTMLFSPPTWLFVLLLAGTLSLLVVLNHPPFRQRFLTKPLFAQAQAVMPKVSQTEQEALDAGKVWWDAEIWSGAPDWQKILAYPQASLTPEERTFIDGPVETFCRMIDDWQITHTLLDLPPEAWQYLKENKFFGLVIAKEYGGLGFSATAHSAVIAKIASRSIPAAVTVMVPNSIGPAELLFHYGTQEQKDYFLPRLATGEEIPCFGLTGPTAGSDASATPDHGIICKGEYQGDETIGIRLNWHKRYITLGPIATIIGLAFKLYDPDQLLGDREDLGITFALIPRDTPGIWVGNRHFPLNCPFQNGPNKGKDVFIPLDMVIGGREGIGNGWSMLMEALAAGRGVSLPALSTGGAKMASRAIGAYAAARKQFNLPIHRFEGVEEALTRIGGNTYIMDSARAITVHGIDNGERPAVVTAIAKYHLTELMRSVINDAMDVQGGAGICLGPKNLLGRIYQSAPIGITVEGANILTRTFIIFNQSLLRCHPFIQQEIKAIKTGSLNHFDQALFGHLGFLLSNFSRTLFMGFGGNALLPKQGDKVTGKYISQVTRLSSAFALVGDVSMLVLGADLKRKEKLTGRLSDVISNLFLTMAVIKHYHDSGTPVQDKPLVEWGCQKCLHAAQEGLLSLFANFPVKAIGHFLRWTVFPLGRSYPQPDDRLGRQVAAILISDTPARDRLTEGIFLPDNEEEPLTLLDAYLTTSAQAQSGEAALQDAVKTNKLTATGAEERINEAAQKNILSPSQAELLLTLEQYRHKIIAVDDFPTL
ncbi:acyl-CoA dehydrogenase [Desulfogranum marinum]|uniref:acyl-CoA dehydrogenase n=1 Tax=Desulfogranum marinum TaxID=453220 RepID=UPI0019653577|nr:acyl-CoA dehydrogenase [Desulfogranum marinum]MBM9512326.1 acyl-CoA dehydrogenase [Desulfogranum marinum]